MTRIARLITVTGRVQGVGFRAFVRRRATELGLDGWVRNRRDGSVEVLAIGELNPIEHLVAHCRGGPTLAKVTSVTIDEAGADGTIGFDERTTV